MEDEIEAHTITQLAWRFIPFLTLCYFVAYLDRVNVGFAKLTMDPDLKLSETAFGFGAGVFFLSYFLFEVPSNVILDKVGARIWIARILFSWGVVSGAMAFIPRIAQATGLSAEHVFYSLRFLLGLAEAGFFPGIIFFLTLWFPAAYRARIVSYFMAAIPLSYAVSSPVSAALLGLEGAAGLRGWQWLFIVEAIPSILLAFAAYFYLTDRPADARWLPEDRRRWLQRRLAAEDARREPVSPASVLTSLYDYRVLALSLVYFGAVACGYGLSFWLPTIVKGFGLSIAMTGWVTAIPCRRLRRHGLVGAAIGSSGGAHDPPRRRAGAGGGRHWRFGFPRRPGDEDDCADNRGLRPLRFAVDLLDAADGIPRWRGSRAGHRGDQLDRQPCGLFRPLCHRLDQGRDRQFRFGASDDRRLSSDRSHHRVGAWPRPAPRTHARSRGMTWALARGPEAWGRPCRFRIAVGAKGADKRSDSIENSKSLSATAGQAATR